MLKSLDPICLGRPFLYIVKPYITMANSGHLGAVIMLKSRLFYLLEGLVRLLLCLVVAIDLCINPFEPGGRDSHQGGGESEQSNALDRRKQLKEGVRVPLRVSKTLTWRIGGLDSPSVVTEAKLNPIPIRKG